MLGSRVLLTSATLPPALTEALFEAYREGRKAWQAACGQSDRPMNICCAWFDEYGYINMLIDLLFEIASELQREAWQNWTLNCPNLKPHQQLWLDPWRTKTDEAFRLERENDDWQGAVAEDFALWLNARLRKAMPDLGAVEKREWETRERLRTNLREMEKIIQEALK